MQSAASAVRNAVQNKERKLTPATRWTAALRAGGKAFELWHLCSLDAPTVAVVWALALASFSGLRIHPAILAVLALGTWIVYVLDRLLDGLGEGEGRLQARHLFHRTHRRVLLCLCSVAALAVGGLCACLPLELVRFYLILSMPVAAYAFRVHRNLLQRGECPEEQGGGSRKEASVALLFTLAVTAPAYEAAPASLHLRLLSTAGLLALLCFLNCALISHVEADWSSTPPCIWQNRRLRYGALVLAALAAADCGVSLRAGATGSAFARAAVVLAALLLLLLLGMQRRHADPRRLRVLADLALLTPLLFLIVRAGSRAG